MPDLFDLPQKYPDAPGHRKRDTSKEAAQRVTKVAEIHHDIMYALEVFGDFTMHQMAAHLQMEFRRVQPRMSELAAKGKIYDTGKRDLTPYGRKAIVWGDADGRV